MNRDTGISKQLEQAVDELHKGGDLRESGTLDQDAYQSLDKIPGSGLNVGTHYHFEALQRGRNQKGILLLLHISEQEGQDSRDAGSEYQGTTLGLTSPP